MPLILEFNKSVSGTLGFTGSLQGTASVATSASIAPTSWSLVSNVPAGIVSSSAQVLADLAGSGITSQSSVNVFSSTTITGTLNVSGNQNNTGYFISASGFSGSGVNIAGVISASFANTDWNNVNNKPTGIISSSTQVTASLVGTQINATGISGSFTGSFVGAITSASVAAKANVAPIVINLNTSFGADLYLTQIPAVITEWDDGQRQQFDFTGYTQARVVARLVSSSIATASIATQYSNNGGTTWNSMSVALAGPSASLTGSGVTASAWFPLNPTVQSDVLVRWITQQGDTITGVKFGTIALHAR